MCFMRRWSNVHLREMDLQIAKIMDDLCDAYRAGVVDCKGIVSIKMIIQEGEPYARLPFPALGRALEEGMLSTAR